MQEKETPIVWRIQVRHPLTWEWITVKGRYVERSTARSWLKFVKAAWHGSKVRTVKESKICHAT